MLKIGEFSKLSHLTVKALRFYEKEGILLPTSTDEWTGYYGIGKFISLNSWKGFWGQGAIDAISERLGKELPGLKGFLARNLRNMRTFYEEWTILEQTSGTNEQISISNLADASANINH